MNKNKRKLFGFYRHLKMYKGMVCPITLPLLFLSSPADKFTVVIRSFMQYRFSSYREMALFLQDDRFLR